MSWDRVERLLGKDALNHLHQRAVGVVGLGSGGSFVAVALAMSGVGRFVLVDDDVLELPNMVRHAADRRYLGQPKAEAVADLIRQRNPAVEVRAVVGRIEHHLDLLAELDLLVAGVDSEGPKYTLNQACLEHKLAAVYAGVYERGEGGDVCLIEPDSGPCYACWAEHLREGLAAPSPDQAEPELDYGMIGPDGTLAAEPGLWLHVVRIAATQADIALGFLLREMGVRPAIPANTVVLANTRLEIYEGQMTLPYGAEWINVPRNPDCLVCGHRHRETEASSPDMSLRELADWGGIVYRQDDESGDTSE